MGRGVGILLAAFLIAVGSFLALAGFSPSFRAKAYSALQRDNRPITPFEIAPGLYYVGSSDIAVFALTTRDGIILIDAGYEATARRVPDNLRALGLDPANVRILLNTHAHVDHAAGLASLKQLTHAQLYASPLDAPMLESGGRDDFFLRDWMTYPPVEVDRELRNGETVTLGSVTLTAHFTPGHTKGCTSWTFPLEIDGREQQVLVFCSLGVLRYRLVNNRRYPNIASDFETTFATLRALPCDVPLGAHGHFFDLTRKRQHVGEHPNVFIDPAGCRAYIDQQEQLFQRRLTRQQRRRDD